MLTPSSKICRKTNSFPAEEKYWAYVNQITERIATCACDDQSLVMRGSINKYYTSSTLVPQKYSFEWYNLYNRRPVRGQLVCFLLNPKRCTRNWRDEVFTLSKSGYDSLIQNLYIYRTPSQRPANGFFVYWWIKHCNVKKGEDEGNPEADAR